MPPCLRLPTTGSSPLCDLRQLPLSFSRSSSCFKSVSCLPLFFLIIRVYGQAAAFSRAGATVGGPAPAGPGAVPARVAHRGRLDDRRVRLCGRDLQRHPGDWRSVHRQRQRRRVHLRVRQHGQLHPRGHLLLQRRGLRHAGRPLWLLAVHDLVDVGHRLAPVRDKQRGSCAARLVHGAHRLLRQLWLLFNCALLFVRLWFWRGCGADPRRGRNNAHGLVRQLPRLGHHQLRLLLLVHGLQQLLCTRPGRRRLQCVLWLQHRDGPAPDLVHPAGRRRRALLQHIA